MKCPETIHVVFFEENIELKYDGADAVNLMGLWRNSDLSITASIFEHSFLGGFDLVLCVGDIVVTKINFDYKNEDISAAVNGLFKKIEFSLHKIVHK